MCAHGCQGFSKDAAKEGDGTNDDRSGQAYYGPDGEVLAVPPDKATRETRYIIPYGRHQ
jgi:hypothetical protein